MAGHGPPRRHLECRQRHSGVPGQRSISVSEVRRHPRRRFIILLAISGLLLMALVLIWILYRPGVMASLFAGRLGDMLGGEVEYEEAVWLDLSLIHI